MKREIKFRAWDIVTKEWKYILTREDYDYLGVAILHPELYEISLYTGLHDKNGKEIYEGDIVKNDFNSVTLPSPMKVVSLWDLFTRFGIYREMYGDFPKAERLEIIGNIYSNPELLK